jgi:hypothetical protein
MRLHNTVFDTNWLLIYIFRMVKLRAASKRAGAAACVPPYQGELQQAQG